MQIMLLFLTYSIFLSMIFCSLVDIRPFQELVDFLIHFTTCNRSKDIVTCKIIISLKYHSYNAGKDQIDFVNLTRMTISITKFCIVEFFYTVKLLSNFAS